jgi:hypothetical protein
VAILITHLILYGMAAERRAGSTTEAIPLDRATLQNDSRACIFLSVNIPQRNHDSMTRPPVTLTRNDPLQSSQQPQLNCPDPQPTRALKVHGRGNRKSNGSCCVPAYAYAQHRTLSLPYKRGTWPLEHEPYVAVSCVRVLWQCRRRMLDTTTLLFGAAFCVEGAMEDVS